MTDLAVLGQDPRFPGGSRVQAEAFWRAARALGRQPILYWLSYRGLRDQALPDTPLDGESTDPVVPGFDGLNQLVAGKRLAPQLREATSVWAVTTVASHGYGAALSGRRYGIWAGTSLADEWESRRRGLPWSRKAALAGSARMLRRLERETLRRAARVYATSPASRSSVAAAGGLAIDDVRILPIPVDTTRFVPAADQAWRDQLERPTLAFVGRADDPRKNLPTLLDAFAAVRKAVPGARLVLTGPATATVAGDGIEGIGEVADVSTVFRSSTVFVLPSLQEGFGIVAAEALACGLPVVTTPSGGPEHLVRASGGGRVIADFSAAGLAEALIELLNDPESLTAMRIAGRPYVAEQHAPARFQALLSDALREVDES